MGPTTVAPDETTVVEMRVFAVNPQNYSVHLISDGPNVTSAIDVPWNPPYRHPEGGGLDFMPEVGSTCWCLWHPYDSLPLILCFSSPASRDLVWGSGRLELNPGDLAMWTRDNNKVVVRRGGGVEIISTKECKRIYVPARHAIEDTCRDWHLRTRGGTLDWVTVQNGMSASDGSSSLLELRANRFGQDAHPAVTMRIGDLGTKDDVSDTGTDQVFELFVGDEDNKRFSLVVDQNGNTQVQFEELNVEVLGDAKMNVNGSYTVSADKNIELEALGNLVLQSKGDHTLNAASSTETLNTSKHINASTIMLGRNPSNPAVLGRELLQWLITHAHPPTGGPPIQGAAAVGVLSSKVFME